MTKAKIPGGYYLKARCIQDSEISNAPPYVREIWDFLIRTANHQDHRMNGSIILRGQCVITIKEIQDGLSWNVGYRKMQYEDWRIKKALKWLADRNMIAKHKTTRGMVITVVKYNYYQDPSNYHQRNSTESTNESTCESTTLFVDKSDMRVPTKVPGKNQSCPTINNNEKNKDIYTELFDTWNSLQIIKHRTPPKSGRSTFKSTVDNLLKDYAIDEIKQAMQNYSKILKSDDHYFDYHWTVTEFLIRGFEKFMIWGIADGNYQKRDKVHEKPEITF